MNETTQLTKSFRLACQLAPSLGHSQVVPAHLLLILLEDSDISFLLNAYGVDIKEAKTSLLKLFPNVIPKAAANNPSMPLSEGLNIVLNHAKTSAAKNNMTELNSTFMFATLLREENAFSNVLDDYDLSYESVIQFIEMQSGASVQIDPVPAYNIDPAVFTAPPPSAAPAIPTPQAAPPKAAAAAMPVPAPSNQNIPAPALQPTAVKMADSQGNTNPPQNLAKSEANNPPQTANRVISFANIQKRHGVTAPEQPTSPGQTQQQQPISRAVTPPPQTPQAPAQPQMQHTTFSATGSVIEKGILVFPEHIQMKIGKPQTVEVRIAQNPQAQPDSNDSYDKIIMEALTTQLHAPGQNFHIKSLLPETHWIDNNVALQNADYGQWRWEVTPLQRGNTKLSLVVSSRTLDRENQLSSVTLPEKTMKVSVGMNATSLMIKLFILACLVSLGVAAMLLLPKFW